jgi:hypothetical protein
MSSEAFRNAIRADWPRLLPGLRFIETINRSLPQNPPLPLPDVWGSLGFVAASRRHLTMGATPWVEEKGVVTFLVVAKSGHGDSAAASTATTVMRAWEGWTDPTGDLWIDRVGAPEAVDGEAMGNWYLLAVACDYTAQERVQLP